MRVLMCQTRFHGPIRAGTKTGTIRGKARCKPGDELSLRYWKDKPYRSIQLPLLPGPVICKSVLPVRMYCDQWGGFHIVVDEEFVTDHQVFATAEGFRDIHDLRAWFEATHELPFEGELIKWK